MLIDQNMLEVKSQKVRGYGIKDHYIRRLGEGKIVPSLMHKQ